MRKIAIVQYRWGGSWGPVKIKVPCGECGLNENITKDVIVTEYPNYPISFTVKDWLPYGLYLLLQGGWHAPITLVNEKIINQGKLLDRHTLSVAIDEELHRDAPESIAGTVLFSQPNCKYCTQAKEMLNAHAIEYTEYNVVTNSREARRMFRAAKKHLGNHTPVTTPQIWLHGEYIGGTDALKRHLSTQK